MCSVCVGVYVVCVFVRQGRKQSDQAQAVVASNCLFVCFNHLEVPAGWSLPH